MVEDIEADKEIRANIEKFNEIIHRVAETGDNPSFVEVFDWTDEFAGHEVHPEFGPNGVNPDRWFWAPHETLLPEWFHMNPAGHKMVAEVIEEHRGRFGF